ncbi:unnamed protein product [Rhizoctonia solani]|uniref:glucan 1,3-beta-glucosidase n=1 Tax=Rhizoctonia solani TaxID=456999 RepID=A0A8H3E5L0_9AGAM|nr:unnamed protein product [Rhizoctonia solani]
MATHSPYEAETLLPPGGIVDPATARSSVANSLGVPASSHGGEVRESQYSSAPLNPPYDPYAEAGTPSPRGTSPSQYRDDINEKTGPGPDYGEPKRRRPWFWLLVGLVALAVIVVAVVVPVYFKVIKPNNNTAQSSGNVPDSETSSTASAPEPTQSEAPRVVTGGAGSLVTTDTGNTFIYNNSFGGIWYHDPEDPFKLSAQAQSWSPPLNQSWRWGIDQVRGVGIGGWLVLEPFISPALYEPYMNDTNPAVDEWTLCESIAADPNSGGLAKVLEDHYSTFIVEEDFAQIAAAGLNWVREFSNAFNDCGFFLNGVNLGARYDGTFKFYNGPNAGAGSCVKWMDQRLWSTAEKEAIKQFALSSFDAYQHYFFWTWKIGKSTTWGNIVASPLWSYQHGLENGWMPKDAREATGACGNTAPWVGPLPASKTGGAGAGTVPAEYATARSWPPPSLSNIPNAATLPTYTATGTLKSLSPAQFTGATGLDAGNGWANVADQQGLFTPVAGCSYPSSAWGDAADATNIACSGGSIQRAVKGRYALPRETGVPA